MSGRQKRALYLIAGLTLLAGLTGLAVRLLPRPASADHPSDPAPPPGGPDPRRAYPGPYRNIHPDVRYVGDQACAECHPGIARQYASHPMGRSLVPAAQLADRQRYSADSNNPFFALGRRFEVVRQGDRVRHRQAVLDGAGATVVDLDQEVDWAIGSGAKGHSYLSERDGYLLQTAISWFTQKQRWDLSPGFPLSALAGRVVPASCLFCHANRMREHPEHPDRFVAPVFEGHAIGCERCHGPGELHVKGDLNHTIVNPARLPPLLRDAVCEQCHLEGEARVRRAERGLFDYRPGLPLHDFWAVLVEGRQSGEDAKAVNHVEQMVQSRCYRRPVGGLQLGCITCHDPHVHIGPAQRVPHYRAACLKCHHASKGQRACSFPLRQRRQTSPEDSCIACHMPRYTSSDIVHTASTDHRILRHPAQRPARTAALDGAHLVDFYRERFPGGDPQAERNRGLGLVRMLIAGMLPTERDGGRAVLLLESALAQYPKDAELRQSKTLLLGLLGRSSETVSAARQALAERPGDWRVLAQAALATQAERQAEQALTFWRQAVEINPVVADYQAGLIEALIRTGRVDEVPRRCRDLLRLDPFSVSGRQALVGSLLQQGKKAEARRQFEVIRRLKPPDLAQREEWFRQQR